MEDIISELNGELYDKNPELDALTFSYTTCGNCSWVSFDNTILWTSEEDGREWIEKDNDYEPMLPYLRQMFNIYIDDLKTLRLDT